MLDIWSDHSAHQNLARLDVIIVVLILIEVRRQEYPCALQNPRPKAPPPNRIPPRNQKFPRNQNPN